MNHDLAQMVREALEILGCDSRLMSDFDGHSTIALNFSDLPSLLIARQGEQVWIWSHVCEYSEALLAQRAFPLLEEIMTADSSLLGGHPSLMQNGRHLDLRAIVDEQNMQNSQGLAEAISSFFERVQRCSQQILH